MLYWQYFTQAHHHRLKETPGLSNLVNGSDCYLELSGGRPATTMNK